VEDLGPPIAYTVLEEGTPVYDANGKRIGVVEHVLADWQLDIFEGLIVHTRPLPGRHVFADAEQIAEMRERGVVLSVESSELREPGAQEGRTDPGSGDTPENPLEARLRRAWDWISGRRPG
jgi:sporulation protein YlmC with PRC-barrel domain